MSFNASQFRDTIKRCLAPYDPRMASPSGIELICLTCAVESDFGTYFRQIGGGPGRGCMSIEPPTCQDVVGRVILPKYPDFPHIKSADLETDIKAHDIPALARYWKKYYNTSAGKGTVEKAVEKYERYCR